MEEIIEKLDNFSLKSNYLKRLRDLTDAVLATGRPEEALEAMLGILERYPEEELGSPGPLVRAIEKCRGYQESLLQSLEKQPGTLTLWMLYRLIKKEPESRYFQALEKIAAHPKASEQTKEDAEVILSWYKNKA